MKHLEFHLSFSWAVGDSNCSSFIKFQVLPLVWKIERFTRKSAGIILWRSLTVGPITIQIG